MEDFISFTLLPLEKVYKKSLLIFTRDYRVQDNYTLEVAGQWSEKIIPVFIFKTEQINKKVNKYFSDFAVKFLCESLDELYDATDKKLSFHHDELADDYDDYDAIFISKDYTDYAVNVREKKLINFCKKTGKNLILVDNHLLEPPLSTTPKSNEGVAYTKYTPYYNAANKSYDVLLVNSKRYVSKFIKIKGHYLPNRDDKKGYHHFYELPEDARHDEIIIGGRSNGKKILNGIKQFKNYDKERDDMFLAKTTRLSAHNKFGTVSIREVYNAMENAFGKHHGLIRQLWWREFFYNIAISFPHVTKGKALKEDYDRIKWSNSKEYLKAWKTGTTGYPIVDAAMKQLTQTGYMHNRGRLIVSSFLIKDLHIDWREGEKFFARNLVDYDPIVNNGSWQWSAGSGADSQPYFRILNPDRQAERFDPEEKYVEEYLSEPEEEPIINHSEEVEKTKKMYKKGLYG